MAAEESIRVRARGVITLPKALRERFGISQGSLLSAREQDDGILIRRIQPPALTDEERVRLIEEANEGYRRMQADPEAWAEHVRERELWDVTLLDGLTDDD